MKRELLISAFGSALLVSAPLALASKAHLDQCINHAVNGPKEIKHRDVEGHTFHCYPVHVKALGDGRTQVKGTLIHEKFGRDDKVRYQFIVEDGKVDSDSMQKKIEKGFGVDDALTTIAGEAADKVPGLPEGMAEDATKRLKAEVDKGWKRVANKIIDLIASKAAKKHAS